MTDVPDVVQIGPFRYDVAIDPGMADHCTSYGHVRYRELAIRLASDQAPDQLADTLLHEVLHACLHLMGRDDDAADEVLVGRLSAILLDVLRRNPALVAFLMGDRLLEIEHDAWAINARGQQNFRNVYNAMGTGNDARPIEEIRKMLADAMYAMAWTP